MTFRDDITQAKQQKSTGDIIALVIRSTWSVTLSQLNRKFTVTKGLSKNRELLSWSIPCWCFSLYFKLLIHTWHMRWTVLTNSTNGQRTRYDTMFLGGVKNWRVVSSTTRKRNAHNQRQKSSPWWPKITACSGGSRPGPGTSAPSLFVQPPSFSTDYLLLPPPPTRWVANFVESSFESSFELLEFVNDDILLQQRFSIFAYNYVVHLHISSA